MINNLMHINNNAQVNRIYQMQSTVSNVSGDPIQNKTTTDTVSISHAGKNAAEKFQEIAGKYDVNIISVNERDAMAKELYENKLINEKEYIHMTIPYCCADLSHDIEVINAEKRDFLSLAKYNYELSKDINTPEANAMAKRVIDIFEQIKAQGKS